MNALPYVISSRVRLARNLRDHRFPQTASDDERKTVLRRVRDVVSSNKYFRDATIVLIDLLSPLERKVLEEKHLISHLFATQGSSRLAILPTMPNVSILVNEEDHLRLQAFSPGLSILKIWETVRRFEQSLQKDLDFAYSKQYGYLTTCPENTGLGIRVSAMLFVPGLILLKRITPLIQRCISAGYTIRGTYGEGSPSQGYVLQISNQRPHEQRVMPILKEFETVCRHMMNQEKLARLTLLTSSRKIFQQRIMWTRNQLSTQQTTDLNTGVEIVSICRLMAALGIQNSYFRLSHARRSERYETLQRLDRLNIKIQPAHVGTYGMRQHQCMRSEKVNILEEYEDMIRAQLLQYALIR